MFVQHNTKNAKKLHFDPGKIAVMVWSGSATHPSNCTRLWVLKVENIPWEAEVRHPGPNHKEG